MGSRRRSWHDDRVPSPRGDSGRTPSERIGRTTIPVRSSHPVPRLREHGAAIYRGGSVTDHREAPAEHRISGVEVHLVSMPITGGFADATRKVETLGYTIVRVHTDTGLEGIGFTYHEVGGEATKVLIERNFTPRLL